MGVVADFTDQFGCDTLGQFVRSLDTHIRDTVGDYIPSSVMVTFTKTGYVRGGWVPGIENCDRSAGLIRIPQDHQGSVVQRVFATCQFGPDSMARHDFVLIRGETEGKECVWVGRALLLCRVSLPDREDMEMCFVQYMDVIKPLHKVDEALRCVCLRWATGEDHDYTMLPFGAAPVERSVTVGAWYGTEPFGSLLGVVHVLRANYAVHPLTPELPWSHHRFYVNRFYVPT